MKSLLLTVGSLALTASVVGNAYIQNKQFYPSVVYITKSSPSMAVLYVQAFVGVILMGKLMRKIFFGQLRAAEMEHLIERSWYAVTETCLAFTVFRDDFSPRFVALFTLLLFIKCFHWLAEDRVDYMERSPVISWLFHMRALSLLSFLAVCDAFFISHAYYHTLIKGASVQLVFGFEYAILLMVLLHICIKYVLHTIDVQNENSWENKAIYLLYTELLLGFVKMVLYMLFLAIMVKVHTFPLFAIRPMYLTMRVFKKALNDVVMSRQAIRNMNTLYPDATPEELSASDVCIICREEMTSGCKKLPCNHIFHKSCLRSWFQRQQSCPTCRMDIIHATRPQPQQPAAPPAGPPQQPAVPQFPGGVFPGFPGAFPAGAWPGQAPPASSATLTSAAASTTSSGTTSTAHTSFMPGIIPPMPFMMPPFMMPPFGVPPPPPPADLSGLSEEELRAMEGEERDSLESRVQCLRNIHTLLDAAMLQIQQYTAVVARRVSPESAQTSTIWSTARPNTSATCNKPLEKSKPTSAGSEPAATHDKPTSAGSEPAATHDKPTAAGSEPAATHDKPTAAGSAPAVTHDTDPSNKSDDTVVGGAVGYTVPPQTMLPSDGSQQQHPQGSSESKEIRRRRLERFSNATQSQENSTKSNGGGTPD